jgi:cellulose synthase/poly-beta-1,6-N-acetylglucosamine synthase-like glycosyltransferase
VLTVFNGERFLREAIESILSQTFRDFDFIIINDGSTDGTASILESYERSDSRVQVCHQENKGRIASLNRGCGLARGKYIALMDADDVSVPDRLERQIGFLENQEKVGLLGGAVEGIDNQGRRVFLDQPPLEDESIRAALLSFSSPIFQPAVLMRKQAFDATGGYRPQFLYAEDYDLWLRIIEGWRVANLSEVVLRKRIHSNQFSVCNLRQAVVSALAAHALSLARQRDAVEPPCQVPVISEEFLERLGVSQNSRQMALVGGYAYWIRSMSRASQDDAVLRLVDEVIGLARSRPVSRYFLSYAKLWAARIHYRQGRPLRALVSLGQALLTHPKIVGRPLKRAVSSLFRKSQAQTHRV